MVWAPASLVGLPCAALLILAPAADRQSGFAQPLAGMIGAVSVALLVLGGANGGRLGAVTSAYIVIATAAFVSLVLLRPDAVLRQAVRSIVAAGIAAAVLIELIWGPDAWRALAWEATRAAGMTMRSVVEVTPDAFALYEPMVRFISLTWPGMLALQTLAGLALAWQLHVRIAARTATVTAAPLTRFKDFRIGDGWVWGIVAWLIVLILPVSSAIHIAGTNVGLVAGTLYVLRGAAIVATFAEAFGISTAMLVIMAAAAAALAVPMLFVLPGLCTLGITDTWYQYRRRLGEARQRGGRGRGRKTT
ncbi:MAG TPA: DUF2232 domain-containing protein [Gemmatimonadales bacterium]|nr:DUF2232 domain-containing protein [Gemmatimonadales bacterium]